MTPEAVPALLPFAAQGIAAVLAMLAVPFFPESVARWAVAVGLGAAAVLAVLFLGPAATAPPLLAADALASFGTVFASVSGLAILGFGAAGHRARETPALLALVVLGASVLAAADHAATLFLGAEIASLALVALFAFPLTRPAVEAGYKYFLLGGIGSGALLLGLAAAYAGTGGLGHAAWTGQAGGAVSLGLALILAGLALRLGLAPLHMWVPDVFAGAPRLAAALSGALFKGALAVALLRLGQEAAPGSGVWTGGLAVLGALSVLLGNALALTQEDLGRMLGHSSVAHSGYIALILSTEDPLRSEATLFYAVAYAAALVPALGVAGLLTEGASLTRLHGLLRRRPVAGAALGAGLLSLAGLPISAGFVGKIYLFAVLARAEAWPLLGVALAGTAMGLVYCIRFLRAACAPGPAEGAARPPLPLWPVLLAATAITVSLGLAPRLLTAQLP